MNIDAQHILNLFQSIGIEVSIAERIATGEHKIRLMHQLYMLQRLTDAIFTPELLDAWEHEAGRGERWTKADNDLTEDF